MSYSKHLSAFVKYHREQSGITQEQLALKAGVGLRFLRELEQGKETLRLDKINKVLELFGHEMRAEKNTIDAYEICRNYFNKAIVLTFKNKQKFYGFIIQEIINDEQKIIAWKAVPNNNAIEWQRTKSEKLIQTINHSDIAEISLQQK